MLQDIRHAFRLLARNPGFTVIAVLSLALGIGANTAVFSLADTLLLHPLPITEPGAVMSVNTDPPGLQLGAGGLSYPDYLDMRGKTQSFEGMTASQFTFCGVTKAAAENPQLRVGALVSDNFFRTMGVQVALGRTLLPEEGQVAGRNPVVVLSYDYWRSEFGLDRGVLNRTLRINGIDFTIVGVLARNFTGTNQYLRPHFYVPAVMTQSLAGAAKNPLEDRTDHSWDVYGRLKPGVTRVMSQAELTTLWKGLEPLHSEADKKRVVAVRTEFQERVKGSPPDAYLVMMLMALVAVVLLIACANVANLLLGRARARTREIAIRLALGVSRTRLVRQLLTESVLLAMLGVAVGLGFAYGGIRFLGTLQIPTDLPIVISPQLDGRVLLFSLIAGLISALAFGLAPALQSSRTELVGALKNAEGSEPGKRMRGRSALVIGQVAMSMILLVATGMLLDGFRKAVVLDPGFRTDHVLTTEFDTSMVRYTPAQTHDFYKNLLDRARGVAGVRNVTMASVIPMGPQQNNEAVVPEGFQFAKGQLNTYMLSAVVDQNYFSVMQTPMVRGRAFTEADKDGAPLVAIVNEQFARMYWPNQDPVGKRLQIGSKKDQWLQVVGVTSTGKYLFVGEPPMPFLYLPFAQNERSNMVVLTQTYGDPAVAAAPLREIVRTLDPNQPVFNVRSLSDFYQQRAIALPAFIVKIVATLGTVGLTLALIGLYGLVAYSVARRTREIGVRMAIGASPRSVLGMVLKQGLALALGGIVVGGVASIAVARLLTVGLIGLGSPNRATYVVVPVTLLLITLVSCYVPARRAAHVDPMSALRCE